MLRLKESSKVGYLRLAMETPLKTTGQRGKTETTMSTLAPSTLAPSSAGSSGSEAFPRGESAFELSRQFPGKSPLARVLSESSTDDPKPLRPKMELRATPRRAPRNGKAALARTEALAEEVSRSCEQHSFLTDITDVRQMEQGLLQLLHDFHSGKLQAFGKDCTFEKMENVREQQERLARLHFDLNAQQELCGSQSEEGRRLAKENLNKLIENLQHLSQLIEQLQSNSQGLQTDV